MRAGPLGAYLADDRAALVDAARTSAAVTHAHDEGKAGAIAVALAASAACTAPDTLLEVACAHTPRGRTHEGLVLARTLGFALALATLGLVLLRAGLALPLLALALAQLGWSGYPVTRADWLAGAVGRTADPGRVRQLTEAFMAAVGDGPRDRPRPRGR